MSEVNYLIRNRNKQKFSEIADMVYAALNYTGCRKNNLQVPEADFDTSYFEFGKDGEAVVYRRGGEMDIFFSCNSDNGPASGVAVVIGKFLEANSADLEIMSREKKQDVYRSNGLVLDAAARELYSDGKLIALAPKESDLLAYLMEREGRVCTGALILEDVWGLPSGIRTRTVDVHVGRIRRKLGREKRGYIKTVNCIGYEFSSSD